ncbi:hypothetical protein [Actinomadura sp. 9N215]|uniref:hypothetical protein n=1 Tax=Actinomadura sp. 9N215 TaxID=3375150 RepID=UPI00379E05B5
MPRCTRCNAPLDGSPPGGTPLDAAAPPSDDTTSPDAPPGGDATSPDAPSTPPWTAAPQGPVLWETTPEPPRPDDYTTPASPPGYTSPAPSPGYTVPAPPSDYTTPMPPGGEETTQLSPEPWSEPAIWQPPAPPKKSRVPYFLAAAGVVLLLGLALGIVFWPSGSGKSADPRGGGPSAQQSQDVVPESEASGGDLDAQAKAVDALLAEMGTTRSDLGTVVVGGCERSGLQRVLDARRSQLEKARALDVTALENGTQMKDALVRALEASSESNQRYLDGAPGCPSDGEVVDVNQRASDAKSEFIGYWTPIAQQAGLPARTANDI